MTVRQKNNNGTSQRSHKSPKSKLLAFESAYRRRTSAQIFKLRQRALQHGQHDFSLLHRRTGGKAAERADSTRNAVTDTRLRARERRAAEAAVRGRLRHKSCARLRAGAVARLRT